MRTETTSGRSVGERLKGYLLRGTLFVVPAVVTVGIVVVALRFLSGFLAPVASFVETTTGVGGPLGDVIVLGLIVVTVLVLGAVIETVPHGVAAAGFFHSTVESVPGVGSVYAGFREMSTTIANGEESFRDVKLVEYPSEGSYTMAFVTADAPPTLEESAGHAEEGMVSLFLPMGPNPVMGGFVIYVSRDRVHDIDISVEEGLQAIITSGVAMGESERTAVADRIQPIDDP
ncbi:MAG: DUF502 domain-containing protein [Haloarculaceae archaeon]